MPRQQATVVPTPTEEDRVRERFRFLIETAKQTLEMADRSLAAAAAALQEGKK